ncbi:enterochelin ABC transporter [Neisseria shayeganii]|uniref:Enterochelin ABC transporter n=1 Tax=Neisseria shayeganii TaxID=607712 RepID=A0A7D7NAE8_9NEIS|nr:enterochelin ABC transporter [Neisseria shayeganii]QMT39516.1 enterochelin ABC transporter [Neisseria shayeganii]
MADLVYVLFVIGGVAVQVFHLYTFFSEAGHLNRWPGWQVILCLVFTGTLFIYFVSPSARLKGVLQLALILACFALVFVRSRLV